MTKLTASSDGDAKSFGGSSDYDFTTPTGFDNFDYLNGQIVNLDNGEKLLYTGVSNGRIVQVIGKSGSGKSTFAAQMAANITKRYGDLGLMYYYDFEKGTDKNRIRAISGMSEEYFNDHVTILKNDISTEKVLLMLYKLKEFKKSHEKDFLVDNENNIRDEDGKLIKVMAPTCVIIDSLSAMMSESTFEEESIQGQMSQTGNAKINAQFFRKAAQVCDSANIILIIINHITAQVNLSVTPMAAEINYLKVGESLPGGTVAKFMTDTLIKITTGSKLEEDKLWGIKGFEAKVEICKSRHAPAGRAVNMIFDQTNGFQNELSMLDYLKSNGALKGNGMAYYIDGYDKTKFRLSNFKEKLEADKEFKDYFYSKTRELLQASIRESENTVKVVEETPEENTEATDENQQ